MTYPAIRNHGLSTRTLARLTGFSHQACANALRDDEPGGCPELHAMLRLLEVELLVSHMLERYPGSVVVLNSKTYAAFGRPGVLGGAAAYGSPDVPAHRFEMRAPKTGRVVAVGTLKAPPKRPNRGGATVAQVLGAVERCESAALRGAALAVLNSTTATKGTN